MVHLDKMGDRACVALCWLGLIYIAYSHYL
jgi:hypothetical protein